MQAVGVRSRNERREQWLDWYADPRTIGMEGYSNTMMYQ